MPPPPRDHSIWFPCNSGPNAQGRMLVAAVCSRRHTTTLEYTAKERDHGQTVRPSTCACNVFFRVATVGGGDNVSLQGGSLGRHVKKMGSMQCRVVPMTMRGPVADRGLLLENWWSCDGSPQGSVNEDTGRYAFPFDVHLEWVAAALSRVSHIETSQGHCMT